MTATGTLADPSACTHPADARVTVTDHGTFDYDYVVCPLCLSEFLMCEEDCCGCPCCDAGTGEIRWSPVTDPDHVPAGVLDAAGLGGAGWEAADDWLRARYEAARAAGTEG